MNQLAIIIGYTVLGIGVASVLFALAIISATLLSDLRNQRNFRRRKLMVIEFEDSFDFYKYDMVINQSFKCKFDPRRCKYRVKSKESTKVDI